MADSAPVAEYQEWPLQGFLKRTRIGNQTRYNLEFQLPHVPELGLRFESRISELFEFVYGSNRIES